MLKFGASIFGGELPIGLGVVDIAIVLPGGDFLDEGLFVGNAAIEAWDVRTPSSDSARSSQPAELVLCPLPDER
jgi:hypothetical protein